VDDGAPAPFELDAALPSAPDARVVADAQLDIPSDAAAVAAEPSDASLPDAQVPNSTARTPLVVPERWLLLDAAVDPFADRPATVDCSSAGVVPETLSEERVLGVETGWCNYLTALQPTQRAVQPGELIKVRLWHFELSAPEPAEAHAAVHIAGLRVLDEHIAIPGPGGLIVKQFITEQLIPAGAPVHFHLHNHGANSWALVEVSAGPATSQNPAAEVTATSAAAITRPSTPARAASASGH
jgi:hypothetical protein